MADTKIFTEEQAREIGDKLGIDWKKQTSASSVQDLKLK